MISFEKWTNLSIREHFAKEKTHWIIFPQKVQKTRIFCARNVDKFLSIGGGAQEIVEYNFYIYKLMP